MPVKRRPKRKTVKKRKPVKRKRAVKRKPLHGKGIVKDTHKFIRKHKKEIGGALTAISIAGALLASKGGSTSQLRAIEGGRGKDFRYIYK